uniref:PAS domain-containing protein n=1 Tax=Ditylum brightwellii TaxID=49249 RepID=A0A6V2GX42_9STRA
MSSMHDDNGESLCETAKLIASVLDCASERAVLIADDGTVLHMNSPASHFLNTQRNATSSFSHVNDFLQCQNWRTATRCHVVMKDGTTTRSERNIHMQQLDACPCCTRQYYTAYICSKHERVREVLDHAFDPVVTIDCSGIICTANDATMALFGYSEGELVGHNISMLCGGSHAVNHDRYMRSYMETGVQKIIGIKREVQARKKSGVEFPCELGIQEITDASSGKRYFSGFIKDLTLIKQHEEEIKQRQALAQGMINASFDPMLEIDEAGIIKIVNDAACNMFGYTREEFIGSNVSMICGGGHAERHAAYMERYLQTGIRRIIGMKRQVKARRKDGSEFDMELGVQEVILSEGKRAFCGFIRDLTAQKSDKQKLRKQQQLIHGNFFGAADDDEEQG